MDLFLVLTAAFMLAAHVSVLHAEAGRDLPFPTDHLLVLLTAALLAALGLTVPLIRTRDGLDTVAARWRDRARRPVGVGLMLTGALTGLLFEVPPLPAVVTGALLGGVYMAFTVVVVALVSSLVRNTLAAVGIAVLALALNRSAAREI